MMGTYCTYMDPVSTPPNFRTTVLIFSFAWVVSLGHWEYRIKQNNLFRSNEKLEVQNTQKQHCLNQTKVDCTPRTVTKTVPRQVQKQRPITRNRQKCSQIPNRQPDRTVSVPVTKVVYRTMCYNVPRYNTYCMGTQMLTYISLNLGRNIQIKIWISHPKSHPTTVSSFRWLSLKWLTNKKKSSTKSYYTKTQRHSNKLRLHLLIVYSQIHLGT